MDHGVVSSNLLIFAISAKRDQQDMESYLLNAQSLRTRSHPEQRGLAGPEKHLCGLDCAPLPLAVTTAGCSFVWHGMLDWN